MSSNGVIFVAVLYYAICIVALFVVPLNRNPSSAIAWLMLIIGLPYLGVILFLLLGSPKLTKRRRAQQHTVDEMIKRSLAEAKQQPELLPIFDAAIPELYLPLAKLNANLGGMPTFAGNTIELLSDYDGAVENIMEAIEGAQTYVHVEYYIFADGSTGSKVIDALIRAQQRGVVCRILIDHFGNFAFNRPVVKRLRAGGVMVHMMLPVRIFDSEWSRLDLRNHRKIVVVDGQTAFTGSQNLIDRDYHKRGNRKKGLHYIELVARVTGPVVSQLDAVFRSDWYAETRVMLDHATAPELALTPNRTGAVMCQVLPSGPGFENENNLKLFVALFYAARRQITIATPYFVPDENLMMALTSAAQRGVKVTLIVSEISDQFLVYHAQRSYYEELLAAGVRIERYRSPILLHAKHLSIDDDVALIGSSNMDMRSFQLDQEVTLVCYDTGVVAEMQQLFVNYLRHARPVNLGEWQARPLVSKLFDNLARLTSVLQ